MKLIVAAVLALFIPACGIAQSAWVAQDASLLPQQLQVLSPKKFVAYRLDEALMQTQLANAGFDASSAVVIDLPLPNGGHRDFSLWRNRVMPKALAEKYPDIVTYTGQAVGNASITVKADFTCFGFHSIIFDGNSTALIDPYDNYRDGLYMVRYGKDEAKKASQRMGCLQGQEPGAAAAQSRRKEAMTHHPLKAVENGTQLRSYRLAISADEFYCQAATGLATPTIAQCLSAMTTTLNRVNGVYEREIAVTMQFVAKEDTLIFPTATSVNGADPFAAIDALPASCLATNQTVCDSRIGDANYDMGHIFTTGAGGLSMVGCVCQSGIKAQSVSGQPDPVGDGFDINYVAHEMGHELGADHTFNDNMTGACNGNAVDFCAYEPGSGSTIMCYAGICFPDDIQANSDAYFAAQSLVQIHDYITTDGDVCASKTSTENLPVHVDSFSASYSIPYLTPFELTAPTAVDSTTDTSTTYCWEQWNLGDFGLTFSETHYNGPIFRSYSPTAISATRVFPNVGYVAAGIMSDAGTENAQGEKVPDVARYLTFKLTVRDIYLGNGCFLFPNDTIHLDVINTGTGFSVSSQNSAGIIYTGGTTQTITWNLAGTPSAPISAPFVDIFMSVDGGYTWMYDLGTYENTGSAEVVVPNPPATVNAARFKVKGHGNVFFNVNSTNFTVDNNPSLPISTATSGMVATKFPVFSLYPNPAGNLVNVASNTMEVCSMRIYDVLGRQMWSGSFKGATTLSLGGWPKGTYNAVFTNGDGVLAAKQFVVE